MTTPETVSCSNVKTTEKHSRSTKQIRKYRHFSDNNDCYIPCDNKVNYSSSESSTYSSNNSSCLSGSNIIPLDNHIQPIKPKSKSVAVSTSVIEKASASNQWTKPHRLCPICDIYQSKLSRHLLTRHMSDPMVAKAAQSGVKERSHLLDLIKKKGILKVNKLQARLEKPNFVRERQVSSAVHRLVMCPICSGFYSQKLLSRHRRHCIQNSNTRVRGLPLTTEILEESKDQSYEVTVDGFHDILARFRDDEIGNICREEPTVLLLGKHQWLKAKQKVEKKFNVRRSIMASMRYLSHLFLKFKQQQDTYGHSADVSVCDMFCCSNFEQLASALQDVTGPNATDNHVINMNYYYVIQKTCQMLKGIYLMKSEDDKMSEIDKFVNVLELRFYNLSGGELHKSNIVLRNEKLRRPDATPDEEDISTVRQYILLKLQEHTKQNKSCTYPEIRDLTIARLTLFNGRRGGEPSCLSIKEITDAFNEVWIDKRARSILEDPIDIELADSLTVAYQTGKDVKHLPPVLLPKDTIEPLKFLIDAKNRHNACVSTKNTYVFASTQHSACHATGWHAIHNVCSKLTLKNRYLITAIKNRHRISTLYAALDIPEERRYCCSHMGHSKKRNEEVHQSPLSVKEVGRVEKMLINTEGM